MIRYILISLILLLTASTASAATKGAYSIYRIDATTSKASLLAQGTESKRGRVMTLCRAHVKKEKFSGIRCVWSNKMIPDFVRHWNYPFREFYAQTPARWDMKR